MMNKLVDQYMETLEGQMGAVPLVIFDLDGTLIDISSIQHLFGDWEAFADATMKCPPVVNVVRFARFIQLHAELVIVTGKPDRLHYQVVDYLAMLGILPDLLLMRPKLDTRPDAELKLALMDKNFTSWRRRVLFAVEDRDKAVDAWRAAGITCLQCAPSLY